MSGARDISSAPRDQGRNNDRQFAGALQGRTDAHHFSGSRARIQLNVELAVQVVSSN